MDTPADFSLADREGARAVVLTGDWTAIMLGDAGARLTAALKEEPHAEIDAREVGRFDTAGALALVRAGGEGQINARPETQKLLTRVGEAMAATTPEAAKSWSFNALMERLGRGLIGAVHDTFATLEFNGRLLVVVGKAIARPKRIRWAAVVGLTERVGIDAIPVVVIANFFIGAVLAFLASATLADFGAQIFAVEAVGIGVLREFGVVITAVLLAGRSASAFAAEIGAMKMQQEVDAMQIMGVDPFEALVLPRFLAMMFIVPLTFLADLAGLFGGALVLWGATGLSPVFFAQRIPETVGLMQFWLGMAKAPVMAIFIAAIGCRQGMLVGGDVESLGRRVTAAVVHAIFAIIVLDALFALLYLQLDV